MVDSDETNASPTDQPDPLRLRSGQASTARVRSAQDGIADLTIAAFQKHISGKYEKVDRERGSAKTFLWFIEEVGELATALNGNDRENLQEEFADVLAWLCTLANINDIDLNEAVTAKYLGAEEPDGHK